MDKLNALAKKVGANQPQQRTPNRNPNNQRTPPKHKKGTPTSGSGNRNSSASNQNNFSSKVSPMNETEMEKHMRKRIYKALYKHKRDKRLQREKAKSMGERIKIKSKEARLKGRGMDVQECSSTDDSSSSCDDMDAIKYLKVPIDKKKDDFSQLQTHEFGDKDKTDDIGDFFYSLNRRIKFDYCSHLNSKMKPDILTSKGLMKGSDYTFDFLKSGPKSTQVLEVRAFYDSDEDKYYEHINDYVHDQLSKHLPDRSFRYYNDDVFKNTLLCDLCHKLGHTVFTCKHK